MKNVMGSWFASSTPLDEATVSLRVPALHGVRRPGLSVRYGHVRSSSILDAMLARGYDCVGAGQVKTRNVDRRHHARHVLQFTRPELKGMTVGRDAGDIRIVISNSHDGTGAYICSLGLFRHACTN